MQELMEAVRNNDLGAINQILIQNLALVNGVDNRGYSPLVLAAEHGRTEAARVLLQRGAQINFFSNIGINHTALMAASIQGHIDVVEVLLEHRADVTLHPNHQDSPIILAAQNFNFEIVRRLVVAGANPNDINRFSDGSGRSSLHYAAQRGDLETVDFLIGHEAEIDLQDGHGFTPLMIADAHDQDRIIEYLLANDANLEIRDNEGRNVTIFTIGNGNFYRVWLYLTEDQNNQVYQNRINDINAQNEEGNSLLHLATADEDLSVIFRLLFSNESINTHNINLEIFEDSPDESPDETIRDIVRLRGLSQQNLLVPRINIAERNDDGKTPWDIAIESRNLPHVRMFLAAGSHIDRRTLRLARGFPYMLAILRLCDISDRNRGLEHGREVFARNFIEALFNHDTNLEDEGNINYAFIISSIEARIFIPGDIAQLINNNVQQRQQLLTILAHRNDDGNSEIFDFIQEVELDLIAIILTHILTRTPRADWLAAEDIVRGIIDPLVANPNAAENLTRALTTALQLAIDADRDRNLNQLHTESIGITVRTIARLQPERITDDMLEILQEATGIIGPQRFEALDEDFVNIIREIIEAALINPIDPRLGAIPQQIALQRAENNLRPHLIVLRNLIDENEGYPHLERRQLEQGVITIRDALNNIRDNIEDIAEQAPLRNEILALLRRLMELQQLMRPNFWDHLDREDIDFIRELLNMLQEAEDGFGLPPPGGGGAGVPFAFGHMQQAVQQLALPPGPILRPAIQPPALEGPGLFFALPPLGQQQAMPQPQPAPRWIPGVQVRPGTGGPGPGAI
jgi:ankyrin repeat protein